MPIDEQLAILRLTELEDAHYILTVRAMMDNDRNLVMLFTMHRLFDWPRLLETYERIRAFEELD
jgi:hypothetical protein